MAIGDGAQHDLRTEVLEGNNQTTGPLKQRGVGVP